MVVHDEDTGSDDSAPEGCKRTTEPEQSTQKRPPDALFQGPAKRARTSSVTCVNPVVSPVSDDLLTHTNNKGKNIFPLIFSYILSFTAQIMY
jgi:hypothetical protein